MCSQLSPAISRRWIHPSNTRLTRFLFNHGRITDYTTIEFHSLEISPKHSTMGSVMLVIEGLNYDYRYRRHTKVVLMKFGPIALVIADGFLFACAALFIFALVSQPVLSSGQQAPQSTPKPIFDGTGLSLSALVEQFKNEKVFWRQFEIAKEIVKRYDASVLSSLVDWLNHEDRHIRGNVAFIFGRLGDARGLQVITDILNDRSERPEGQAGQTCCNNPRYSVELQIRQDRYYAAHLLAELG